MTGIRIIKSTLNITILTGSLFHLFLLLIYVYVHNGADSDPKTNNLTTTRPDACKGCFLHNLTYLINNESICKGNNNNNTKNRNPTIFNLPPSTVKSPFLLLMIMSRHEDSESRDVIRSTWAKITQQNSASTRHVFIFGRHKDATLNRKVFRESDQFGDVIVVDFVDSYNNLTLKTLMGLKWAATFCKESCFVLKVDNDNYVNVNNLMRFLNWRMSLVLSSKQDWVDVFVGGRCSFDEVPIRGRSKWRASWKQFPHSQYPPFCHGPAYVVSTSGAAKIVEASKDVPFFYLEDVYVTGLVAHQKLGVELTPITGFVNKRNFKGSIWNRLAEFLTSGASYLDVCYIKRNIIAAHPLSHTEVREMWRRVQEVEYC